MPTPAHRELRSRALPGGFRSETIKRKSEPSSTALAGLGAFNKSDVSSCIPGLRGGQFTGAGATIEFLRENFVRDADMRQRVLEGVVRFDPAIGIHPIPLSKVAFNNVGRFRVPLGWTFLLTQFETFASDANGIELNKFMVPQVIFNTSPQLLAATTFFNGNPFAGLLAGESLSESDLTGLAIRFNKDFVPTYEVIGVCPIAPTFVSVRVKGFLINRELLSEALDVVCPSGGLAACEE